MAFKLTGDQGSGIRLGQRRRVRELLSDNVPADEAVKMRDGRYACLVCDHRPVLDTVAMLSVHRLGQKHVRASHVRLQKQEEKQLLAEKRQSQHLTDATPLLTKTRQVITNPGSSSQLSSCQGRQTSPGLFFSKKRPSPAGPSVGTKKHQLMALEEAVQVSTTTDHSNKDYVFPWRTGTRKKTEQPCPIKNPASQARASSEHYLKLRSAGWLRNNDGSWRKDSNVEFDSDEEP